VPQSYLLPASEADWADWAAQWEARGACKGTPALYPHKLSPEDLCGSADESCEELAGAIRRRLGDLESARWNQSATAEEPFGWDYGIQPSILKVLLSSWLRALEDGELLRTLNEFDHVRFCAGGLDSHAAVLRDVCVSSSQVDALVARVSVGNGASLVVESGPERASTDPPTVKTNPALFLLHGWPSSPLEYWGVLRTLRDLSGESADCSKFDVVVPSLPGFGYSAPATRPAPVQSEGELWNISRRGPDIVDLAVWVGAMARTLGYASWDSAHPNTGYAVAGGDYGGLVASVLSQIEQSSELRGVHLAMWPVQPVRPLTLTRTVLSGLTASWSTARGVLRALGLALSERDFERLRHGSTLSILGSLGLHSGYMHQQATFPDTLASTLFGDPLGTAAWVGDKFVAWEATCFDARPGQRFSSPGECLLARYPLLDLLLIVQAHTLHPHAGLRLYRDALRSPRSVTSVLAPNHAPAALLDLGGETLFRVPFQWGRDKYLEVVQEATLPNAGHFAAMEEPVALTADVLRWAMGDGGPLLQQSLVNYLHSRTRGGASRSQEL
jgi:pimeloyl-ACP methyl ester carboxylesterase